MTVREVAERILFGTTLEEKLTPPSGEILDVRRGKAIEAPAAPGRPPGLRLQQGGVRASFPGVGGIEDDAQRGRLLHFFANHELLATELMALVLLKFPDAPGEFRAGVLRTLREEQMHTKLYLKRMAECGVEFGDVPVNGFFWNAVSPMSTPLDYVTRLSLTFEQANLDYSRGYAEVFARSGDPATAEILERIYRDEISHVSYGLEWFRRWKEGRSDWQEFVSCLAFPLSAARAKGAFAFNEAGRKEAGLDNEFIAELKVYAQSKGRTPNVFWFNPGAEESLVGSAGAPTRAAQRVACDLAVLPAFLARQEDVLIVPEMPSTGFLTEMRAHGIVLPEMVDHERVDRIAARKLHALRPWARTPDARPLIEKLGIDCDLTDPLLFSKATHAEFLRSLLQDARTDMMCPPEVVGVACGTMDEVRAWTPGIPCSTCVLKAPFSTAGRNRRLHDVGAPWTRDEVAWIDRILESHGAIVVEPWLERELDFSVQYDISDDGRVRRRGVVVLENSSKGQFRRATVADRFTDFLDPGTRRALFAGAADRGQLIEFLDDRLDPALLALARRHGYAGPLGVDAFLYRDHCGQVMIKPVVEINPRYTMGRVAIELARFTPPNAQTSLTIAAAGEQPDDSLCITPRTPASRLAAYLSPRPARGPE